MIFKDWFDPNLQAEIEKNRPLDWDWKSEKCEGKTGECHEIPEFLFNFNNQSVFKVCRGCHSSRAVPKALNLGKVTGPYESFVAHKEDHWQRMRERHATEAREREAAFVQGLTSEAFYSSNQWLTLRHSALLKYGRKCMCCGGVPPQVILQVDHIRPRSKFPDLALDIDNLQVLCKDCNLGKSNKFENDFRGPPVTRLNDFRVLKLNDGNEPPEAG